MGWCDQSKDRRWAAAIQPRGFQILVGGPPRRFGTSSAHKETGQRFASPYNLVSAMTRIRAMLLIVCIVSSVRLADAQDPERRLLVPVRVGVFQDGNFVGNLTQQSF